MMNCSGNDFIFSLYIDTDEIRIKYMHEKDETCRDSIGSSGLGTACIVTSDTEILESGYTHDIISNQIFKKVDSVSVFYIDCIVKEHYQVFKKQEKERNKHDLFMVDVFSAYMKFIIKKHIESESHTDYEDGMSRLGDVIHWVLTVPDAWNSSYLEYIKQHIICTGIKSINHLTVVPQSYALIRHLQLPHYGHQLSNGEYYIVCLFTDDNRLKLFGYEIGTPIKGLNSIANHTFTDMHVLHVDYGINKYLIDTVFNSNEEEIKRYNINLGLFSKLCHYKYWKNFSWSFYDMLLEYKNTYLTNVKESFLVEKQKELKSITVETIRSARQPTEASYLELEANLINMSRAHHNVKVMAVNDVYIIENIVIWNIVNQLPVKLSARYHHFILTEGSIFTTGAAQIIQSQLRIDNYIPQVENKGALDSIIYSDIMYIDISWDNSYVQCIDLCKKITRIKKTSSTIQNCYSLNDCVRVTKHEHQFHLFDINTTEKYNKMLRLDKQNPTRNPPTIKKKKITSASKVSISLNVPDTSITGQLRSIVSNHLYNPAMLEQYKSHIPRDQQKEMLIMYIECLQVHVLQYMISKGVLLRNSLVPCYFSIDQSILDTFLLDHEEVRGIFEEYNTGHLFNHPMKLIHREQVSAVHCKDAIECHSRVEEYLDYPQYMMQVQLNPTYIDLALNVIMPLDKDITLVNNETVLTLKRKRIQYSIVDVMSNLLWDHLQSREEVLISTCYKHQHPDYDNNENMYLQFINHFSQWFTREYTMLNNHQKLDWYKEIPMKMNTCCDCTLLITPMDFLDICILPAIRKLMFIIYGATTNISIFGNYRINHIVLMGSIMNIKCSATHNKALYLLRECIERQNRYYNHISVHWINDEIVKTVDKGMSSIKNNPSGGLLEQIVAGAYYGLFDGQVYASLEKSEKSANEPVVLIKKNTRITEDMRENGILSVFFFARKNIKLTLCFSAKDDYEYAYRYLYQYTMRDIDSFPITIRSVFGITEILFHLGTGAEGQASIETVNTNRFSYRESWVLAPYV
ncbi:hypothetical protein BDB01DRAFT_835040 [Pilobolus umbonatus]|nr:hypothetical protein BDB01DRAFT_835040 [Pilobolus umbonatus]